MSTCDHLDLGTLGNQPIVPENPQRTTAGNYYGTAL